VYELDGGTDVSPTSTGSIGSTTGGYFPYDGKYTGHYLLDGEVEPVTHGGGG